MPEYARDSAGRAHVLRPPQPWIGLPLQQRFRFCDRDGAGGKDVGDFTLRGNNDEPCSGPATCLECRMAVQGISGMRSRACAGRAV